MFQLIQDWAKLFASVEGSKIWGQKNPAYIIS